MNVFFLSKKVGVSDQVKIILKRRRRGGRGSGGGGDGDEIISNDF